MDDKKVLVIQGRVRENRLEPHDRHYIETDDGRIIFPAYVLQWFVDQRVSVVITVLEPEPG